jgi:hypothetical protein
MTYINEAADEHDDCTCTVFEQCDTCHRADLFMDELRATALDEPEGKRWFNRNEGGPLVLTLDSATLAFAMQNTPLCSDCNSVRELSIRALPDDSEERVPDDEADGANLSNYDWSVNIGHDRTCPTLTPPLRSV